MVKRYSSRMYISPRTRYWRRVYFAAAAIVILAISIATLYSLSDKSQTPQTDAEPPQKDVNKTQLPVETQPEPERFSAPIDIKPQPQPENPEKEKISESNPAIEKQPEQAEMKAEPAVISTSEKAAVIISEAQKIIKSDPMKIIKARDMLNEVLGMDITSQQRTVIKQMLSALADKWLFSKDVYPGDTLCSYYRIQSGDLLSVIGKKHKVPWEILKQINGIYNPALIQADQSIKVINGPFHARVYKSKFTMDIYLQDTFVKSFPVGLGKTGYGTPTGLWLVKPGGKLVKPRWTDPDTGRTYEPSDPDYPLGSRWIALEGLQGDALGREGFAIHGTKDANEIGTAASRGCIRLHNGNAILVYNLMTPGESKVEVVK